MGDKTRYLFPLRPNTLSMCWLWSDIANRLTKTRRKRRHVTANAHFLTTLPCDVRRHECQCNVLLLCKPLQQQCRSRRVGVRLVFNRTTLCRQSCRCKSRQIAGCKNRLGATELNLRRRPIKTKVEVVYTVRNRSCVSNGCNSTMLRVLRTIYQCRLRING